MATLYPAEEAGGWHWQRRVTSNECTNKPVPTVISTRHIEARDAEHQLPREWHGGESQ
jgi:hypothetical protein